MKTTVSFEHAAALRASALESREQQSLRANTRMYIGLAWAFALGALVAGFYLRIISFRLWVSLIVLAALLLLVLKNRHMQAVDWSLLLVAAFEIVSLPFSQYSANSFRTLVAVAFSALMFFAVRLTIRQSIQVSVLSGVVAVFGACLGLSAIDQFAAEARHLQDAGFSDLLAFRSRLITPPAPWISGEWFTLILLTLPFACAVPAYLWCRDRRWPATFSLLPASIIAIALTFSLSRAAFWSTVLFCFSVCAFLVYSRTFSFRFGGVLLGGTLGLLILILACESAMYPSLLKTYIGQHTTQTRSTQGRERIWTRSFELARAHPLVGVGSSNAALMLLSTSDDEGTGFAGRTFSLPIQVLLEKGIIGVALYSAFLALASRECLLRMRYSTRIPDHGEENSRVSHLPAKPPRTTAVAEAKDELACQPMVCCFAAGLIAVLSRELTYSSLMEHNVTMVLVAISAALVCRPEVVEPDK